jgi:predicted DNA-binding protein (MmcQ/YjbR family)
MQEAWQRKGISMSVKGAQLKITSVVTSWADVTTQPHRFGGLQYAIESREIGHIHGDHMLDIPFPKKVRDQLVAEGRAQAHHFLPDTGWVSFYIQQESDIEKAIALLQESFEIAIKQKNKKMVEK